MSARELESAIVKDYNTQGTDSHQQCSENLLQCLRKETSADSLNADSAQTQKDLQNMVKDGLLPKVTFEKDKDGNVTHLDLGKDSFSKNALSGDWQRDF